MHWNIPNATISSKWRAVFPVLSFRAFKMPYKTGKISWALALCPALVDWLLYTWQISFKLPLLLFSFHRWGNWDPKGLRYISPSYTFSKWFQTQGSSSSICAFNIEPPPIFFLQGVHACLFSVPNALFISPLIPLLFHIVPPFTFFFPRCYQLFL